MALNKYILNKYEIGISTLNKRILLAPF